VIQEGKCDLSGSVLDPLRDLAHDRELAVGLTHHAQKAGDEYRGSSAIGASVEWVVMLSRERDDQDRTRRKLSNPLARFARERPDRWLSIHSTDDDDGPVSLAAADPFKRSKPRDDRANDVLDALSGHVQSRSEIARETGLKASTAKRLLEDLEREGEAKRRAGGWILAADHVDHTYIGGGQRGQAQDEAATPEQEALFDEYGEEE
jgi:hypothetical protein